MKVEQYHEKHLNFKNETLQLLEVKVYQWSIA